ncbi:KxYKxGKxW signal peptide domain-containing protein, partial [Secundilactobacillus silagei]|uniref:KxYKxGKxW signal peptide domain-containing protein n=5 Tax=Secundilactobacillus silagei TaxID=1293415 RepID=UPI001058CA72
MIQKNQHGQRKLIHDLTDEKLHYKMYKVGKNFVFAGLLTLGFSAVLATFSPNTVRADTQQDTETESTGTVSAVDQSSTTAVLRSSSSESSGSDVAANTPTTAATATTNSTKTSTDNATTKSATKVANPASSDASSSNVTSAKPAATPASRVTSKTDSSALSGTNSLSDAGALSDNSAATANTTSKIATTNSSDNVKTGQASSDSNTTTLDLTQNSVKLGQGASNTASSDAAKVAKVDLTAAQTAVLTSLPTGSTYKVGTDGTLTIALTLATDETTITSIQSRLVTAGFKSVNLTASAADETWRTYSTSTVSDEQARTVQNELSNPITMGDLALVTAAGTGSYPDLNTNTVVTNATAAQLQTYYNELETKYTVGKQDPLKFNSFLKGTNADTFAKYMNYFSEIYYYFNGASDSYINQLSTALNQMSPQQKAAMAQDGVNDIHSTPMDSLEHNSDTFSNSHILVATENNVGFSSTPLGTYTKPASMDSDFYTTFSQFVNSIFSTYIDAIVPSAEQYVLNKIMPAVDTITDTQGMTATTDAGIRDSVDGSLYQLVHSLMTIDGSYSLTTIVPQLDSMYAKLGSLGDAVGAPETETLAEYVGAAAYGSVTGTSAANGKMTAFSNFSTWNNVYYAYSRALVSTLYGSAMFGKYKALSIMYSENAADPDAAWTAAGISATTAPSDIKVANLDSSIDTTKTTQVETFQQGVWDVYHYIKPFYDAALKDLANNKKISGATEQATEDAVWSRVTDPTKGGQILKDSAGDALTLTPDASVDTSETNPHEQANYVSPQSKAYFTSFYDAAVKANALSYSEQPVYTTTLTNSDGDVISTTVTNLGKPITTNANGASLTGVYGGSIDTSNLPASLTFDGKPISEPSVSDLSKYAVPENGGVIQISYGSNTVKEGQAQAVSVTATNAPTGQTFDYTITNSDGATVSQKTGVAFGSADDSGLTLSLGQTLTISNYATGTQQPTVTPATSLTYDEALLDGAGSGKAGIVVAYTNNQSKDSSNLASDDGVFNGASDKFTSDQSNFISDIGKSGYDSAGISSDLVTVNTDVSNMNSDLTKVSSDLSNEQSDVGLNGTSAENATLTSDTNTFNTDSANTSSDSAVYGNDGVLNSDDTKLNNDLSNFNSKQSDFNTDQSDFSRDVAISDTTSGILSNELSNLSSDLSNLDTSNISVNSDVSKETSDLGSAATSDSKSVLLSDYNGTFKQYISDENKYASDRNIVKSNALSNDQSAINSDQTKINSDSTGFQSDQSTVASDLSDSNTTSATLTSDENKTSNDLSNFSDDNGKLASDTTKDTSDLGSDGTVAQKSANASDQTQLSNDQQNYNSDVNETSDDQSKAKSNALSNDQSDINSDQTKVNSDSTKFSDDQSNVASDLSDSNTTSGTLTSDENKTSNDLSNFSSDNSNLNSDTTKETSDFGSNGTSAQKSANASDQTQKSKDNSNYQSDSGEYSDDVTSAASAKSNALSNDQ